MMSEGNICILFVLVWGLLIVSIFTSSDPKVTSPIRGEASGSKGTADAPAELNPEEPLQLESKWPEGPASIPNIFCYFTEKDWLSFRGSNFEITHGTVEFTDDETNNLVITNAKCIYQGS